MTKKKGRKQPDEPIEELKLCWPGTETPITLKECELFLSQYHDIAYLPLCDSCGWVDEEKKP